jgi:hypothetical protein
MLEFNLMTTRRPKKPTEHDNDRIAQRNLEDHLGNWIIARPTDESSGIEYGQDFLITIVEDDGIVTSNEFRVQSKVVSSDSRLTSENISSNISIKTLNYLNDLITPVLLHFINKKTGTGYVMWLNEWYSENWSTNWEKQNTVLVKIPLRNELDLKMKELIKNYVKKKVNKLSWAKKIAILNETEKDFKAKIDFSGREMLVQLEALNDKNVPQITALNEEAGKTLQMAMELGLPYQLSGKFGFNNIPKILAQNFDEGEVHLLFLPRTQDLPRIFVRINFLDGGKSMIFTIPFLEMIPIQNGSAVKRWSGVDLEKSVIYTLSYFAESNSGEISINISPKTRTAVHLKQIFDVVEKIGDAVYIQLIDVKTDKVVLEQDVSSKEANSDPQFEVSKSLVEALHAIYQYTGIDIIVPQEFLESDVNSVLNIADIIKSGIYKSIPDQFLSNSVELSFIVDEENYETALKMLINIPEIDIPIDEEMTVTLFGSAINLGKYSLIVYELEFVEDVSQENGQVAIKFKFSKEKSYTRFHNWPQNSV